jgi:nitrate/TMAO reductase-like tetraheme cytochrome c subunit
MTAETETKTPAPRGRWRRYALVGAGAAIFLFLFFLGSLSLVHYTESTAFCSSCHVMKPEVTVYRESPHARTECGACHIGPGAWPVVEAKLASARYLYVYPLNLYERPIKSPIVSLRPVEYVCEQCHWPQKFYEDRLVTLPSYAQDEKNSLSQTVLVLKTGGGREASGQGRGIHWHIENPVYYVATDEKRQDIPWVRAEFGGKVTEYLSTDSRLTPDKIAQMEVRKMDCVDCHNRATHVFRRPVEALDDALARGLIPAELPFIKQQGGAVLEKTYATEAEGAAAVASVEEFYRTKYPDLYAQRGVAVKQAVAGLQALFDQTQFPFMNANWQTHPNNIGHKDFPGCFRCHDGKHLSSANEAIRLECNICHNVPQVAGPGQPLPAVQLAAAQEPDSHRSTTWLARHRFQFNATCTACHTVDNPGGSDNTSFCANSACHASAWKYVGLNAPKIRELSAPPKAPGAGAPKAIPHPIGARTDCTICHGPKKVIPAPENHGSFKPDMCANCHKPTLQKAPAPAATPAPAQPAPAATPTTAPTGGGPSAIPHELAGRENCLLCHNPGGGVKPAPKDHAGRANDLCQLCHKPK